MLLVCAGLAFVIQFDKNPDVKNLTSGKLLQKMSHHSPGTVVVLRPVTAGEVGIGDRGAGIGGMDELAAANVNAYMGNAAGICTGKENDVAGLQAAFFNVST